MSPSLQSQTPSGNNEELSEQTRPPRPSSQEIASCLKVLSYVEYCTSHNTGTVPMAFQEVIVKAANIQHYSQNFVPKHKTKEQQYAALIREAREELDRRLDKERIRVAAEECRSQLPFGYGAKVKRQVLEEFDLPMDAPINPHRKSAKRKAEEEEARQRRLLRAAKSKKQM